VSAGTRLLVAGLVLGSLNACSADAITSAPVDERCVSPPAAALDEESAVALTINPNPVSPGSEAVLSVSSEGLPADALHGIAALWQCWNGSEWVSTHALFRGVAPCQDPTGPPKCGEPSVRDVGDPQLAMVWECRARTRSSFQMCPQASTGYRTPYCSLTHWDPQPKSLGLRSSG